MIGQVTGSFLILFLALVSSPSEARVFDFAKASFGNYIRGNLGISSAYQDAYGHSSGYGVDFNETPSYMTGVDFGFILSSTAVGFRLGANLVGPESIYDSEGKDSSGDVLFKLNSSTSALLATGHFEVYPYADSTYRLVIGVGAGTGNVTVSNKYTLTDDGRLADDIPDYTEQLTATALMYDGYLGFEFHAFDSATIMFDVGYRKFNISDLKHTSDDRTVIGDFDKGEVAEQNNGDNRKVRLDGVYGGLWLRLFFL
jgi:hypothetical protein